MARGLRINKHRLDEEAAELPEQAIAASRELAVVQEQLRQAEEAYNFWAANAATSIRANPAEWGVGVVTDDVIQQKITLHSQGQEMRKAISDLKLKVSMAWAAVRGYTAKGEQIGNLVRLHLGGYFIRRDVTGQSSPLARASGDSEVDEFIQQQGDH